MKTRFVCAAACVLVTAAFSQELSWSELARRPELWPPQVSVKEAIRSDGGVSVSAGQKLNVLRITASDVQLSTPDGRTSFVAEPDETDVLATARALYDKLTPGSVRLPTNLSPAKRRPGR